MNSIRNSTTGCGCSGRTNRRRRSPPRSMRRSAARPKPDRGRRSTWSAKSSGSTRRTRKRRGSRCASPTSLATGWRCIGISPLCATGCARIMTPSPRPRRWSCCGNWATNTRRHPADPVLLERAAAPVPQAVAMPAQQANSRSRLFAFGAVAAVLVLAVAAWMFLLRSEPRAAPDRRESSSPSCHSSSSRPTPASLPLACGSRPAAR